MGTSSSSKGAPSNVPLVPAWVPNIPVPVIPETPVVDAPTGDVTEVASATAPVPATPAGSLAKVTENLAPPGRFASARSAAGAFARNGSSEALRRSLGHYVRTGYGGARTAVQRLGGTIRTANSLYSILTPTAAGGGESQDGLDRALLSGKSARDVMDAVVELVRPTDGTQDAEASREAIRGCLSEVLVKFPDADLLALTPEQRDFSIELYVALDVFHRYVLDLGKTIQDKAASATSALARLKDVKDYIRQTVAAEFRRLADVGQRLRENSINQIVKTALQKALQVFENYHQ